MSSVSAHASTLPVKHLSIALLVIAVTGTAHEKLADNFFTAGQPWHMFCNGGLFSALLIALCSQTWRGIQYLRSDVIRQTIEYVLLNLPADPFDADSATHTFVQRTADVLCTLARK